MKKALNKEEHDSAKEKSLDDAELVSESDLREEAHPDKSSKKREEKTGKSFSLLKFISSIPKSWKQVLIVFIIVRILASLTALIGVAAVPNTKILPAEDYSKPNYSKTVEIIAGVWERSDALWYIHIARDGYEPGSRGAVFMPLYPMLIRIVKKITFMPWIFSALFVSNVSFILALYFLYRIGEIEKDVEVAKRAIWYQALYPGSFFLLAPYTESLFLALATGSFLAARTRRWWLAGLAAAYLGATRNIGILIIIPLVIEFIRQKMEDPRVSWISAGWLLLAPLGFLTVMGFWWKLSGDPLAPVHRQTGWQRVYMPPWQTVYKGIVQAKQYVLIHTGGLYVLEAIIIVGVIILGIIAFRKLPLSYCAFLWLSILPALVAPYPGRMLLSGVRFTAVLFPVFLTLACLTKIEEVDRAVRTIFAGLYGLSVALYVASQGMF